MANKKQILAKIARNAKMIGLTVNSESATAVVIENGSNDLTISYVDASIQSPMGGVSDAAAPFLGIGIAAPGKIKISGATTTDTVGAVIDTAVAAKVLALCAGMANNIILASDAGATEVAEIPGHPDLLMMGE